MAKTLLDLATLVRSKNAGPFWLTIDVMFTDPDAYATVRDAGVFTQERIGELFDLDPATVKVFTHDTALALKVSFPRPVTSGSIRDNDAFGGQQYAPLLDIPIEAAA
jgi:hypothetical protein